MVIHRLRPNGAYWCNGQRVREESTRGRYVGRNPSRDRRALFVIGRVLLNRNRNSIRRRGWAFGPARSCRVAWTDRLRVQEMTTQTDALPRYSEIFTNEA